MGDLPTRNSVIFPNHPCSSSCFGSYKMCSSHIHLHVSFIPQTYRNILLNSVQWQQLSAIYHQRDKVNYHITIWLSNLLDYCVCLELNSNSSWYDSVIYAFTGGIFLLSQVYSVLLYFMTCRCWLIIIILYRTSWILSTTTKSISIKGCNQMNICISHQYALHCGRTCIARNSYTSLCKS